MLSLRLFSMRGAVRSLNGDFVIGRTRERPCTCRSLFRYEVASALTRNLTAGAIDASDVRPAWEQIIAIGVRLHGLTDGPAVVTVARTLQRESAYDASYIALAQELDAEPWTLDGPLARNASGADLPVRLIEVD